MSQKKEIDVNQIKQYLEEGCSISEIARRMGIDRGTVRNKMHKYGLKPKEKKPLFSTVEEAIEGVKTFGSVRALARAKGCDHSTILEFLGKHKITVKDILADIQNDIAPELTGEIINLSSQGGVMIQSDHHCPFISLEWHERGIKYAKKFDIKKLVIGGDFLDFDRLSWWLRQVNAVDIAVSLEEELKFAEMIMGDLLNCFEEIYIVGGNHWRRLLNHITYSISNERLLRLIGIFDTDKIRFSHMYDWLLIDGKVRVTHPKHTRKLDGTLARDLALKYPDQWLVVAHRHRAMSGFTPDGRPMIEIGWMGDVNRMRYYQHIDTSYYNWVNGFAVYKDGILQNLFEYNFDWKSL